ncbi:hypothetical protein GF356_06445 [candidate division GN15 bacterium]|nr:hypothetical protein [candidate division GN15 bacterium]
MKKLCLFLATFFLLPVVSMAGEAEFTLEQAQQLALEHAEGLKASRAQRDASLSALDAAHAERWPSLSVSSVAYYVDNIPTIDLGVPGGFSIERELGSKDSYKTEIRMALPVFTGGRIGAGIRLAESKLDLRQALVNAERDQVLLSARVEYLRLHQADRLVASAAASLERAQVVRQDIQSLYDAGAADSTNVLEAELAVTTASLALDQARSNRASQRIRLNLLLGRSATDSLSLSIDIPTPDSSLPPTHVPVTRPQLVAAEAAIAAGKHQQTLYRSTWWPTLSVYGGYTFGEPNRDMFNDAFDDFLSVGANLSWSFNLGRKVSSQVAGAEAATEAARADYRDINRTLKREAHLAREQVLLAFQRYTSAERRNALASDNYRLARIKHREGGLSSNRLLEIEAALSASEAELAAARADVFVAKSLYLYAIGSEDLGKGL